MAVKAIHSVDVCKTEPRTPLCTGRSYAPSNPRELCTVCGADASGRHFGSYTCESCKLFFLRLTQGKNARPLRCAKDVRCDLLSRSRSVCRLCRYKKCLDVGMSKDRIVYGRNARSSHKYSNPRKQRTSAQPLIEEECPLQRSGTSAASIKQGNNCSEKTLKLKNLSSCRRSLQRTSVCPTTLCNNTVLMTNRLVDDSVSLLPGIEGELYLELPDFSIGFQTLRDQTISPKLKSSPEDFVRRKRSGAILSRLRKMKKKKLKFRRHEARTSLEMSRESKTGSVSPPSNSRTAADMKVCSPHQQPQRADSPKSGECPPIEVTLCKDEIMFLSMPHEFLQFALENFNFNYLLPVELERLSNYVKVFECLRDYWLPKLKAIFTCHDVLSCVSDSQQCIVRFIAQVFMPSSFAFRKLVVNYQCSDDLGKVIFPFMNVLLVLPCIDVFFQRILVEDNVVSLDSSFLFVLKELKQMQLNYMEYSVLLQYLPLRALSAASHVQKEKKRPSQFLQAFCPIEGIRGDASTRDIWRSEFYSDRRNHSSSSCKDIISSEFVYINNILVTLLGAAGKLKMLEKIEDIFQNFQFASTY